MLLVLGVAVGLAVAIAGVIGFCVALAVKHRRQVERIIAACAAADAADKNAVTMPLLPVEPAPILEPAVEPTIEFADKWRAVDGTVVERRDLLDPHSQLASYVADVCARTGRTIVLTETNVPIMMHDDKGSC